jgi:hypothetical protein
MECKIVEDITNCSPVEAQRILSKIPCSQEWKDFRLEMKPPMFNSIVHHRTKLQN